jgi:hypothetical protein
MSNPVILGIIGAKGAGKDTLAAMLAQHGFERLAFADALYREVADAYSVTVESLQVRETKETWQSRLSPAHSSNPEFVAFCMRYLAREGRLELGSDEPMSPREVLQQWGSFRRVGDPEYWLKQVENILRAPENEGRRYVITDVRYTNEADMVEAMGGILVRVRCAAAEAAAAADAHPSETELRERPTRLIVSNNGTLDDLRLAADRLVTAALELRRIAA